jgi:hypothetical protein
MNSFELFIKELLDDTSSSKFVISLSRKSLNSSSNDTIAQDVLNTSIDDGIMIENAIASKFNSESYPHDRYIQIIDKLHLLASLCDKKYSTYNSNFTSHFNDLIIANLCIHYVKEGYSLTKEIIECLNTIYKNAK